MSKGSERFPKPKYEQSSINKDRALSATKMLLRSSKEQTPDFNKSPAKNAKKLIDNHNYAYFYNVRKFE